MSGAFLDTNVLVYAFSTDPRSEKAQALLSRNCVISVQGLNEFANVARRKLRMSWEEVREALAAIRILCRSIRSVDIETHSAALDVAQRYKLGMFDAWIVASALRAGCDVLYSEDLQDGMIIEAALRIADPFRD